MSKSKLGVFDVREGLIVAWCDEDGDGEGAWVGQDKGTPVAKLRTKKDAAYVKRDLSDFEYFAIEIDAREWVEQNRDLVTATMAGYTFESVSVARRFLKEMQASLKAARAQYETGVPWPEWAKTAEAAGWKPPKGWKP